MQPIAFKPCEESKTIVENIQVDNEGHMLTVPVYLCCVRPCREIVVGVQIYIKDRLYAMKTKKIFTGRHSHRNKIRDFYVGDFTFLFTDECTSDICVKVLAHYIY